MSEKQMLKCKHCSHIFPSNHGHECSYDQLKKDNEKLRRALEFYSNHKNYIFPPADTPDFEWYEALSIIRQDSGERARKALEGEQ